MAMEAIILDVACGAIILLFAIIGLAKGFAGQLLGFAAWFAALIGAFFVFKPLYNLLNDNFGLMDKIITPFTNGLNSSFFVTKWGWNGANVASYTVYAVFYIVLAILTGVVYALLRKICVSLSGTGVFRVFDKILGVALGILFGAAIVVLLLALFNYILSASWNTLFGSPVREFFAKAGNSISMKYIYTAFMEGSLSPFIANIPFMKDLFVLINSHL